MSGADRPTLPPVRLPAEAELARDALASPLLARAARLARWAEAGVPVGAGGELLDADLARAVTHLELEADEDGAASAAEAWCFAVDTGLVEIDEFDDAPDADGADEATVGSATPGEELTLLTTGGPSDILEIWAGGLDAVLADAATPSFESLLGGMEGVIDASGEIDPDAIDLDSLDWDPEEEGEFLDSALGNLYLLTATDEDVAAGAMVPLPVVAASMVVPDDMREPTDEVLEEVSSVMMRLDEQFRILVATGLLEYDPVDDTLVTDVADGEAEPPPLPDDEEDLTRYGQVRLTPLGLHGVRQRMLGAGLEVPVVGELSEEKAEVLLLALADLPEAAAHAEVQQWLAAREPLAATRELLAAARGEDPLAPGRRLTCQLALLFVGADAEPALREVLDDPELGGLSRVWLTERGAADVPPPSEELVFWLTVDTFAAQLDDADQSGLQELVSGLSDQHSGFFEHAWQVDHPATADVLEAVGRLHPDRTLAKEARRAANRARSRAGERAAE
ncbi:hypothetical protein [Streptomyces sp. SM14]|uniref:hypothetical protein n=2 Tax=unclassified Streptomyces TaxID=2593676 RepID=UPI000CD4F393|nr:hypothetical protein [Streptomyces sp. SM14]